MNGASSLAAWPRMPARNPARLSRRSAQRQPGGAGDRQVVRATASAAFACTPGPYCCRPVGRRCKPNRDFPAFRHCSRRPGTRSPPAAGAGCLGRLPFLRRPQHRLAGQVMPAAAARSKPAQHRVTGMGRMPQRRGLRAGCCPACARTCRAAIGPAASSYTAVR